METPTKFSTIDNTPENSKSKRFEFKNSRVLSFEGTDLDDRDHEATQDTHMMAEETHQYSKNYHGPRRGSNKFNAGSFFNVSPNKSS